MDKTNRPQDALLWFDLGAVELSEFSMDGDGGDGKKRKKRKFRGMAYSGQPLRHPYFPDPVVIDVESMTFAEKIPTLVDHDRSMRAGFGSVRKAGAQVLIEGELLDNEHGRAVAEESQAGFPWQMSVGLQADVEFVPGDRSVVVNGQEIQGPVNVFRNGLLREVSFTATGVDYRTTAEAFALGGGRDGNRDDEESRMKTEELEKKIAELKASLEQAQNEAKAATERAEKAEQELATMRREARLSAVKDLFSALGREFSEEAAKPYLEMSDETFAAVAKDMKAARPKAPEHLFSAQATDGADSASKERIEMLVNA